VISTETKEVVMRFCEQYGLLRAVYDDYRALYEKESEHELLKKVAWTFFCRLSLVLVQYMELRMCALTDPPGTRAQKNLTVKYILELIGPEVSKELGLDVLSERVLAIRPYIIKGRNKAIAHLDREALLSRVVFGEYPRELWDQFWESLQQFVDKVHKHCFGSIRGDVRKSRGAEDLVLVLEQWADYKE
jgi:hypothetical protein